MKSLLPPWWLRTLGLAALLCCLSSCAIRMPVTPLPDGAAAAKTPAVAHPDVEVWVHADKYHTGMVFPYDWLVQSGFVPPADFGPAKHIVISWGNTDAYSPTGIHSPGEWCTVLFTPTPSVLEVIPIHYPVPQIMPSQRLWKRSYPADRGPHLAHFLNQCIAHDDKGQPIVVRPSCWGNGVQLQGAHTYYIPRVCNIWSAQAIEALGGHIKPWSATTANGLIKQIEAPPHNYVRVLTEREKAAGVKR